MNEALSNEAQNVAAHTLHTASSFAPLDALVVIVIGLSCFWGVWKGLSREILGVTVLVLAGLSTFFYSSFFDPWLKPYLGVDWLRSLVSGVLVFGGFWLTFKLIAHWIAIMMRQALSAPIDILLGGIYGLVRGWVVLALLFWFGLANFPNQIQILQGHCAFYPLLEKTVVQMRSYRDHMNHWENS